MRNSQGVLVHFAIGEIGANEVVYSVADGVEYIFAVSTIVVAVVFLISDSGVRAPAPASVSFAVACIFAGLDVP